MKILITRICEFVGSSFAREFRERAGADVLKLSGIDDLSRPGSEFHRAALQKVGVMSATVISAFRAISRNLAMRIW